MGCHPNDTRSVGGAENGETAETPKLSEGGGGQHKIAQREKKLREKQIWPFLCFSVNFSIQKDSCMRWARGIMPKGINEMLRSSPPLTTTPRNLSHSTVRTRIYTIKMRAAPYAHMPFTSWAMGTHLIHPKNYIHARRQLSVEHVQAYTHRYAVIASGAFRLRANQQIITFHVVFWCDARVLHENTCAGRRLCVCVQHNK